MNEHAKSPREPYPSDLTDEQWNRVAELLDGDSRVYIKNNGAGGRPTSTDLRSVANGVLYQARTGIPWRYLPRDISPSWQTVYDYAAAWTQSGTLGRLCEALDLILPDRTARRRTVRRRPQTVPKPRSSEDPYNLDQ